MKHNVGQATMLVSTFMIVQKCIGFIREIVLAHLYGTSVIVDAFAMATGISEVFLGVTTAFGVIFLPLFSNIMVEKRQKDGLSFMNQMLTVMVLVGMVLCFCVIFLADPIISLLASGFTGEAHNLSVLFLRINVWSILLQSMSAVFLNYLNYYEAFLLSSIARIVVSPVQILMICLSLKGGIFVFGCASVAGYLVYALVLMAFSERLGFRLRPTIRPFERLRPVFAMLFPVFLGSALSYINLSIDKIFSSYLEAGSVSALDYAFSIRNYFVQLLGSLVTTIAFPMLSRFSATGDKENLKKTTLQGLNWVTIFYVPLAVAIVLLARPLIVLLYNSGAFDDKSTVVTSGVLLCYCIGLPAVAYREFMTKVYYSLGKTKGMALPWLATLVVNVTGNFLLVSRYGANGLALATSISIFAGISVLFWLVRRQLGELHFDNILLVFAKCCVAAGVMGVLIVCSKSLFLSAVIGNKLLLLLYMLAVTVCGSGVYFLIIKLLRVQEVNDFLKLRKLAER